MRLVYAIILFALLGGAAMAANTAAPPAITKTAIFAGGCFWCMQPIFDETPGVAGTRVGYTGGSVKNPTYEQVSAGTTGHVEAIEVTYDPAEVGYEALLEIYWENVDPTDKEGQFADKGTQYHTVIFVADEAQRVAAEKSKAAVEKKFAPAPVATQIQAAQPFYAAENYHQNYYKTHSSSYTMYKYGSGRVGKLNQLWGNSEK